MASTFEISKVDLNSSVNQFNLCIVVCISREGNQELVAFRKPFIDTTIMDIFDFTDFLVLHVLNDELYFLAAAESTNAAQRSGQVSLVAFGAGDVVLHVAVFIENVGLNVRETTHGS